MAWRRRDFGPTQFVSSYAAIASILNISDVGTRACVKNFLQRLDATGVTQVLTLQVRSEVWLCECNHVLRFSASMSRLIDVERATLVFIGRP
jgi:hypothetical protein